MCANGKSKIAHKTFNLRDVHVTVVSCKDVSVIDLETGDHPILIGPMYLYENSDFKTDSTFFCHINKLCTVSRCRYT